MTDDTTKTDPRAAQPELGPPKAGRGVHLTERAAKEIARVIEDKGMDPDRAWVRFGAKGGGCSGFSYVVDFDEQGPGELDLAFAMHGIRYMIDKKSELFMGGTTVDFHDALLDRGFRFQNPLATGSCGCGTSFSA